MEVGQKLGTVVISYRDQVIATTDLIAVTGVEKASILGSLQEDATSGTRIWLIGILAIIIVLSLILFIVVFIQILKNRRLRKRYRMSHRPGSGMPR